MTKRVRLVDATLRDGSYCIDFQFTAADTAVLVGMLDAAGVGFIELGHGSGTFNHKAPPHFQSKTRQAIPDEEYLAVARKCAKRAKLGVITGPFGTDDLGVLATHRFDFVRLACMADRALEPANLKMAERAKSLGLTFSVNLMQTTAITPARVAEIAGEYARAGADWLYIVDSSGGLLPGAVTEYVAHVRDASPITIGFHAHHNSGLAIANCLAAIDAGATLVDGTLQGLGRDVGNAPTEQLLFMLQRCGHEREIDVEQVSHAGDLVRGLLLEKGNDPTYFAAGASEIHSTNVEALVDFATKKGLGPRSLLAAISQGDVKLIGAGMKTFPEEVVGPACAKAKPLSDPSPSAEVVEVLAGEITRASGRSLPDLAALLFSRAAKWHKRGVLHLVPKQQFPFDQPLPWDFDRLCGITVGVDRSELERVDVGDRRPDVLVIDPALAVGPLPLMAAANQSCVDPFLPHLVESVVSLAAICAQTSPVWLQCSTPDFGAVVALLSARLTDERIRILESAASPSDTDTVIVVDRDVRPDVAARRMRLLRPALATTIATRIAALLDLSERLAGSRGELVDPIFVPRDRQVAVDDPICPTTVMSGARPDDVIVAARVRATTLARGRGRL